MLYDDKGELLQEIAAGEDTLLEFKEVVFKGNQVRFAGEEGRTTKVIVTLFPDRMEIKNPGGLHNTLTVENLYAGCQPVRRNQILAGFLRDFPSPATGRTYMEARGEGFPTLVKASTELSGRRPELVDMGGAVKLILFAAADQQPANARGT